MFSTCNNPIVSLQKGNFAAVEKIISLFADGRLVNLAAGNGHPAEIIDMRFGIQALCLEYLVKHAGGLKIRFPREIDAQIANIKLSGMGISIDALTNEQIAYMNQVD